MATALDFLFQASSTGKSKGRFALSPSGTQSKQAILQLKPLQSKSTQLYRESRQGRGTNTGKTKRQPVYYFQNPRQVVRRMYVASLHTYAVLHGASPLHRARSPWRAGERKHNNVLATSMCQCYLGGGGGYAHG